jgi:hypothetical protein
LLPSPKLHLFGQRTLTVLTRFRQGFDKLNLPAQPANSTRRLPSTTGRGGRHPGEKPSNCVIYDS